MSRILQWPMLVLAVYTIGFALASGLSIVEGTQTNFWDSYFGTTLSPHLYDVPFLIVLVPYVLIQVEVFATEERLLRYGSKPRALLSFGQHVLPDLIAAFCVVHICVAALSVPYGLSLSWSENALAQSEMLEWLGVTGAPVLAATGITPVIMAVLCILWQFCFTFLLVLCFGALRFASGPRLTRTLVTLIGLALFVIGFGLMINLPRLDPTAMINLSWALAWETLPLGMTGQLILLLIVAGYLRFGGRYNWVQLLRSHVVSLWGISVVLAMAVAFAPVFFMDRPLPLFELFPGPYGSLDAHIRGLLVPLLVATLILAWLSAKPRQLVEVEWLRYGSINRWNLRHLAQVLIVALGMTLIFSVIIIGLQLAQILAVSWAEACYLILLFLLQTLLLTGLAYLCFWLPNLTSAWGLTLVIYLVLGYSFVLQPRTAQLLVPLSVSYDDPLLRPEHLAASLVLSGIVLAACVLLPVLFSSRPRALSSQRADTDSHHNLSDQSASTKIGA